MGLLWKLFDWIEEVVMVVGLGIMVVMNFTNVVCRYLLPQTPFSYTEELTNLIFVWITMFGISCGYKRFSHTGLTLVTDMLPKSLNKAAIAVSTLCSAILMIIILYSGYLMVVNQITHGNMLPGLKVSAAYGGLAIPVGAVIIFIRVLQTGFVQIRKNDKKDENQ